MEITTRQTFIFIMVLAIATGLFAVGIFYLMALILGTIGATALIILRFLISLWTKNSIGKKETKFLLLFFLTATITSFTKQKIAEHTATTIANQVINEAYLFKSIHGHFPENINALQLDFTLRQQFQKKQNYSYDSASQHFTISTWNDGWSTKIFQSSDSTWTWTD